MKQQFAAKHPWTILAAGAAIQVLTGLPAAWGVFQQPVMEEYGLSEQGAGYAFALLIAAFGVGCVLGGFLQDKKGPRCAALWGTALLCGGVMPSRMSRMMPPPTAVVTPRTITPSRSIFLCMAVNAPETAKATVPII